jgi:adenine phosphoribosyltransferase
MSETLIITQEERDFLDSSIRRVPDFPRPGILFYDITSILTKPAAFKFCIDKMVEYYKDAKIDAVAGVESRGFVFASPLAEKLGIPLILIRKKGKLPGNTYGCKYSLEYGTAEIEVHKADIKSGEKILVIDDLIATGGTLVASRNLIEQGGGTVSDFFGVIGLPELEYEKVLAPSKITTLINYSGK